MTHYNHFIICNELAEPLVLNIEPEGALFPLSRGEEVVVSESFSAAPLTLKISNSGKGQTIVSIWPGDGDVRVAKEGEDVLELREKSANV
jgi:hypothetical protein